MNGFIKSSLLFLFFGCLVVFFAAASRPLEAHAPPVSVRITPGGPGGVGGVGQGDVVAVTVRGGIGGGEEILSVLGSLGEDPVHFFRAGEDSFGALVGIDLGVAPGSHDLSLIVERPGGVESYLYRVKVADGKFETQRIKLPSGMVEPSGEALKRIAREQAAVGMVFDTVTPERFWEGGFIKPVKGRMTSRFGLKRVLNGKPRSPHSGVDLASPKGRKVLASNSGRVALIGDHYFSGRTVIVDHGLGLYTMYSHLSEIIVAEGREIGRGETVGLVGSSGRATGPHLHWGARLNGARVDPLSLMKATAEEPPEPPESPKRNGPGGGGA
ncbi:MAG: M23 family metallopeptidase [Thermodesulfobacteriota bacterium]